MLSPSTRKFAIPMILEFLGLKDEYSENDLEEAFIRQLETSLLGLDNEFAMPL